jgi:translation machinery-associated protein 16
LTSGKLTSFISRDQEEVDNLQKERRPGRPASSRQDQLTIKIEKEQKEFKTGFLVPDLSDLKTVERLKLWNGDQGGLNVLKFVRVAEDLDGFAG